jgi:hypothetical protein
MLPVSRHIRLVATMVSVACFVAGPYPAHAQTAVTACEQVVEGDGYLTGDLDCPPGTEAAVELRNQGSLDMRGFSIHGGQFGVLCSGPHQIEAGQEIYVYTACRVFGGGTIDGQSAQGIDGSRVDVADLSISEAATDPTKVQPLAITAHKRLRFTNLNLQLAGTVPGIQCLGSVTGTGLTVTGGGFAIEGARTVKIDGVTASGYFGFADSARTVKLANASLAGRTTAISEVTRAVTLTNSVVTGHSGTAIQAQRIKLVGSSVTGNALDLHADFLPRLVNSACETSNGWGVCSND